MEGSETISITALIAGRPYPLKVKREDEVVIRQIVKEVNEKISRFQQTYPGKEKQDHLAMTLLTYAVDLFKAAPGNSPENDLLSQKIQDLNKILDQALTRS